MECFICKKEFVKNREIQKYCSTKCAAKSLTINKIFKDKILREGYWYVRTDKHHSGQRYVAEHRLIMEKHLNRPLLPEETIHHIDHNKLNNDIANLQLFPSRGQHTKHGHSNTLFQIGHKSFLPKIRSATHIENMKRAWVKRKQRTLA